MKISRRKALQITGLGTLVAGLSPLELFSRVLQQDYTTESIRNGVSIFKGRGGTIMWLDGKDGYSVVDTQFPDYAAKLISHLNGLKEKPFKYLINTHHHGDHSAGNIAFKGLVKNVVAHENSKTNQINSAKNKGNENEQLYPDTTFESEWKGKSGKEKITCTYFGAAHTNGDSVIHFENANVAHLGDLLFNRRHPFIDRSAGANIENWIKVLQDIQKHYDKDTQFICGHSGEGHDIKVGKSDIQAGEAYFENLLKIVKSDIAAGKSKEDVLARTEIPGVSWSGDGITRPLTAAYEELTQD
ncbi:MAG: MBL fold metallo-hydrolase [Cyclobacteriaceae bacterium]|nr:MBL fold metallo-hydrolase [Cyclobacteriaceae bacterium]